ncbi:hypothetical protein [Massilia sp. HP4]|uniref:hypothetical protein n=1 Tax=Massilia sp. HP4 TaxID=2562316 RepID=UPI0010BF7182|nr:hypothetical protein [Massilia sp. HP4]
MNDPTPNIDPKNKGRTMLDEADIGSGERSPGQHETDEMIRGIPPLPSNRQADDRKQDAGKEGNDGNKGNEGGGEPPANRQGTPGV